MPPEAPLPTGGFPWVRSTLRRPEVFPWNEGLPWSSSYSIRTMGSLDCVAVLRFSLYRFQLFTQPLHTLRE